MGGGVFEEGAVARKFLVYSLNRLVLCFECEEVGIELKGRSLAEVTIHYNDQAQDSKE